MCPKFSLRGTSWLFGAASRSKRGLGRIEKEKRIGETCTWTQDQDGVWDTECGGRFEVMECTPHENQMNYCPYCGKSLREVQYENVAA